MPARHRQTDIDVKGTKIGVDVNIAPLVAALSKIPEIETFSSCECDEHDGLAWVCIDPSDGEPALHRRVVFDLFGRLEKAFHGKGIWATFSLHWGLPAQEFPIGEIRCDPPDIPAISDIILKFARSGDGRLRLVTGTRVS